MKSFTGFTLAVILTAIFTLFSVPENSCAKTMIVGYAGKSISPNGDMKDQTFSGAAFGGGLRFNTGHRVSFGIDYMSQEGTGPGERWDKVIDGQSIIIGAAWAGIDISSFHVNPNDEYAALTITQSGKSGLATGTLYISFLPENNGSRQIVEPVIGLVGGINVFQDKTQSVAFYHPDLRAIEDLYETVGFEGEHFKFDNYWDDGSGGAQQNVTRYKFVYGISFGLNIYLPGRIVIAPEVRYLQNFGISARTGVGFAF